MNVFIKYIATTDWFIDMFAIDSRVRVKDVPAVRTYAGRMATIVSNNNHKVHLKFDGDATTSYVWFVSAWLEEVRPKVVPLPLPG